MRTKSPKPRSMSRVFNNRQTEADFQNTVIKLAQYLGWRVAHFRGVRVQRRNGTVYYQTPVQADGAGWPDLFLAHPGKNLIIVAEIKSEKGRLSPEQKVWLDIFSSAGVPAYVWRPSDWEEIERILGGQ